MRPTQEDQLELVGEEVEDKLDVLVLFHQDLPPVTVTAGQTPATARRNMTVTITIGWSNDDKIDIWSFDHLTLVNNNRIVKR